MAAAVMAAAAAGSAAAAVMAAAAAVMAAAVADAVTKLFLSLSLQSFNDLESRLSAHPLPTCGRHPAHVVAKVGGFLSVYRTISLNVTPLHLNRIER